jgi:uncharacterized membrane protein YidH (DUF202 family)
VKSLCRGIIKNKRKNKMEDKIIGILIILILGVILAVLGTRNYIQIQNEMNRGPAVYNIKKIILEPNLEKYNIINENG